MGQIIWEVKGSKSSQNWEGKSKNIYLKVVWYRKPQRQRQHTRIHAYAHRELKLTNSENLQDASQHTNPSCIFVYQQWTIGKENQENDSTYNSFKYNKVLKNNVS